MDITLIKANIFVNRTIPNRNYNGVNCYAYGLNISLLPESVGLNFYQPGCFSGKSTTHLQVKQAIANIESDFEALHLTYKPSFPILTKDPENSWKFILFMRTNQNCSHLNPWEQVGDKDALQTLHVLKMQDGLCSHKFGYLKQVEPICFSQEKQKLEEEGYQYIKTYQLQIKK